MNDLSAFDILLYGALTGALVVVLLSGLWALTHRGRQRWSAERRPDLYYAGHVPPRPIPQPGNAGGSEFIDRASKVGHGGS